MTLVPYIILAIISVLISGRIFRTPYEVPRRLLMPLLGVACLLRWWVEGASDLNDVVVWITLGMIGWWIVSTLVSPYHYISLTELSVNMGIVLFVAFGFGKVDVVGVSIIMIGVVLNCAYAIAQNVFKYEPLKGLLNITILQPIGFIGNTNMLGNFLVCNLFMSLWLAQYSRWWMLVAGLITYVIWITKCKGSYLGVLVGGIYLLLGNVHDDVAAFIVIAFTGAVLMLTLIGWKASMVSEYNKQTLRERICYWRVALEQIKHSPIFGIGLDCLRVRIPHIQKALNIKSNGKFLDAKRYLHPWPQKCHNDYIQMVCDVGIPGFVMYVVLIVLALIGNADLILKAGLVAMLITGLLIHNLHIIPVNIWSWFILFSCLRDGSDYVAPWYVIGGLVVILLATYRNLVNSSLAEYYLVKSQKTKNADYLIKAVKHDNSYGFALVNLGGTYQANNNPISAFHTSMEGIIRYDGNIRLWDLYLNAAKTQLMMGGLVMAEVLTKKSLEFYPHFQEAQNFLRDIQNILSRGYQVKRNMEPKNELKTNGT